MFGSVVERGGRGGGAITDDLGLVGRGGGICKEAVDGDLVG